MVVYAIMMMMMMMVVDIPVNGGGRPLKDIQFQLRRQNSNHVFVSWPYVKVGIDILCPFYLFISVR